MNVEAQQREAAAVAGHDFVCWYRYMLEAMHAQGLSRVERDRLQQQRLLTNQLDVRAVAGRPGSTRRVLLFKDLNDDGVFVYAKAGPIEGPAV